MTAHLARRLLLSIGDPTVRYSHHGQTLLMPFSHQLPHHRRSHPSYDEAIGRLSRLLAAKYPNGSLVDIGANVGDTAAAMRSASRLPILCVEADARFSAFLRVNALTLGGIVIENVFLTDAPGPIVGSLVSHAGTSKFVGRGQDLIPTTTLPALLAQHPDFPAPCLVKTDTDGFDFRILLGAQPLLSSRQPVIFFEYDPTFGELAERPARWLFDFLESCGYSRVLAWNNFGAYRWSRSVTKAAQLAPFASERETPGTFLDLAALAPADEDVADSVDRLEIEQRTDPAPRAAKPTDSAW